jgi:hypothetical protein
MFSAPRLFVDICLTYFYLISRILQASPCGSINIAATLDTSTAVTASAAGTFTATGVDFNAYFLLLPLS